MIKRNQIIGIWLFSLLLLPILFTNQTAAIPMTIMDEAEEADGFTTMPNYRWNNQSTTDSAVQEQLVGDYYSVYNQNNQTSGDQQLAKSRPFNSRDLYFDSRFMLETGGTEVEWFADVLGDPCDFNEDAESFVWAYASSTVSDGVNKIVSQGVQTYLYSQMSPDVYFPTEGFVKTIIRYKIMSDVNYIAYRYNNGIISYQLTFINTIDETEVGVWIESEITNMVDWDGRLINGLGLFISKNTASDTPTLYIDYIKIIYELDYATHAEGAVGDTWDWEDSTEYFTEEEDNTSDFNDGTTDGWNATLPEKVEGYNLPDASANNDGWTNPTRLYVRDASYATATVSVADPLDTIDLYGYDFTIPATATITGIEVRVKGFCDLPPPGNIAQILPLITDDAGANWYVTGALQDLTTTPTDYIWGDDSTLWSGGSYTPIVVNSDNFRVQLNLDHSTGTITGSIDSVEVKVYYTHDDTQVSHYDGWLNVTALLNTTALEINHTVSITAATYQFVCVEMYVESGTIDVVNFLDSDDNVVGTDGTNVAAGDRYLYNIDFSADWTGTETDLEIDFVFTTNATTHEIHLNMVYLYDVELGDIEGWQGDGGNAGYWFVTPDGSIINTHGDIDAGDRSALFTPIASSDARIDLFPLLKYRVKVEDATGSAEHIGLYINWYDSASAYLGTSNLIVGFTEDDGWVEGTYDLRTDTIGSTLETWDYSRLLVGNAAIHNEARFYIDYLLLVGNYSTSSEFKWEILTVDDEEGLSIGFNRFNYTSNEYYLNISVYDSIGIADAYSTTFIYDYDTDGWLFIDLELDLDKKEIKFLLEYENGTDILKTRAFADIFNIGIQQLLLFKEGFPQLCMNVSTDPFERVWFYLDYIDANWDRIEWRDPDPEWTMQQQGTPTFTQDLGWSSGISPYGVSIYEVDTTAAKTHYYILDIDRFDAVSFDVLSVNSSETDVGDYIKFYWEAYNVKKNGSLEFVAGLYYYAGSDTCSMSVFDRDGTITAMGGPNAEFESQVSFYMASPTQVNFNARLLIEGGSDAQADRTRATTIENEGEAFTKEWVFVHAFEVDSSNDGANDEEMTLIIAGFDVVRKDWLGDIVGSIINPIVDALMFLLTPLFLCLEFVAGVISKGLKVVTDILGPIMATVGTIIDAAISTMTTVLGAAIGAVKIAVEAVTNAVGLVASAVGDIASDILTALINQLEDIVGNIIDYLLALAEDVADLLFDILEFLFVLLLDAIELLIDLITTAIFWLWDAIGLPDILAILDEYLLVIVDIVAGMPAMLGDLTLFVFSLGTIGLVLWFAWWFALPIFAFNPAEALGEIIDRFFMNCLPITIFGFSIYVPQGIVNVALIYFLIVVPAGAGIAIW